MWHRVSCSCVHRDHAAARCIRNVAMAHFLQRAHGGRLFVGYCVIVTGTLCSLPVAAGLYECRNESGAITYTDSPAQLERCQPVASGDTSRLGLVGGTSPSTPPAPEPINSFPPPEAPAPLIPDPGSATIAPPGGLAGGTSDAPPCVPGINPLNPLSGPPCDTPPHTAPPPTSPPPVVP